jgi:hypothetical protein
MSEPELYKRFDRAEAIALFGGLGRAEERCDGQWVILPEYILCLTTLGQPPGPSHFPSGARFCWAADRPYKVAKGEAFEQFLPEEVRAGRKVERRLRLFVRRQGEDRYAFVGRMGPTHHYGSGTTGKNFGEAYFDLQPTLPSAVWASLGGLTIGDLDQVALDNALDRLRGPLSRTERLETLRHVAEYFHGPISKDDGMSEEELQGTPSSGPPPLPETLRWWYQLVGKRKGMLCCQNYFLDPLKLEIDADGKMVFFCENQGVYLWATLPAQPARRAQRVSTKHLFDDSVDEPGDLLSVEEDPPVWGRLNEVSKPWVEEGMKLSEFLIQVCMFELIMAAPYGASAAWADEATLKRVTNALKELPLPPWRWPEFPTRFFYGNGAFVTACPNGTFEGKQGYSIWAGANTEHPLAFLKEIVDEGWEYIAC